MNEIIRNGEDIHVVKSAKEWSEAAAAYKLIPKGTLCVEIINDKRFLIKIGDGKRNYKSLPYIGADQDLSNYYTKSETDALITEAIKGLGNVIRLKGMKRTTEDLPATGNTVGDVWLVDDITDQTEPIHLVHSVIWIPEEKWYAFDGYGFRDLEDYIRRDEFVHEIGRLDQRIDELIIGSGHVHKNKEILDQITRDDLNALYTLSEHAVLDTDLLKLYGVEG